MEELEFYLCPECGADVPVGSEGCKACGPRKVAHKMRRKKQKAARKKRSWEQDSTYDGLGLPDEDFDYEDYVDREFGGKPHKRIGIAWYWWLTAVVLLGAMLWLSLGG